MTAAQTKGYWRRWQAACKANGWRVQEGCLANAEARMEQSEWVVNTLALAGRIAGEGHRAATLDDVRHAATWLGTMWGGRVGRRCSSAKLAGRDVTGVYLWFRLLADAEDLDAVNRWFHPEIDEREGLVARLRRVPAGYVGKVARDRFGVSDWEGLGVAELGDLVRLLGSRQPFSESRRTGALNASHPLAGTS